MASVVVASVVVASVVVASVVVASVVVASVVVEVQVVLHELNEHEAMLVHQFREMRKGDAEFSAAFKVALGMWRQLQAAAVDLEARVKELEEIQSKTADEFYRRGWNDRNNDVPYLSDNDGKLSFRKLTDNDTPIQSDIYHESSWYRRVR